MVAFIRYYDQFINLDHVKEINIVEHSPNTYDIMFSYTDKTTNIIVVGEEKIKTIRESLISAIKSSNQDGCSMLWIKKEE